MLTVEMLIVIRKLYIYYSGKTDIYPAACRLSSQFMSVRISYRIKMTKISCMFCEGMTMFSGWKVLKRVLNW